MSDFVDSVLRTVDDGIAPQDPRLITIGCVMTNQSRKDWGAWAMVCKALVDRFPNIHFWAHIDTPIRHWNIHSLIADYDLDKYVEVTTPPMDDHTLAAHYRACDLTILPSLGEGWGYTWLESFACGVPCLHVDYAGAASAMKTCGLDRWLIPIDDAQPYRMDTQYNCLRPVIDIGTWVACIVHDLDGQRGSVDSVSQQVAHLSWMKLAHPWRKWLREGLGNGQ